MTGMRGPSPPAPRSIAVMLALTGCLVLAAPEQGRAAGCQGTIGPETAQPV